MAGHYCFSFRSTELGSLGKLIVIKIDFSSETRTLAKLEDSLVYLDGLRSRVTTSLSYNDYFLVVA